MRLDEACCRQLLGEHGRVGGRVDRVARVAHDERRAPRSACAAATDGATRPKKMPWIDRGHRRRAAGRACPARSRPRTARRPRGTARVTTRRPRDRSAAGSAATNSSGANARIPASSGVVEHRHLRDQPADPLGCQHGDLERDVGAQRRAADDGLLGAELVEQRDRPARRRPSSSTPAGRRGRSERPWPSRSTVTTWAPAAARWRASGWCIRRGISWPWIRTTQRSPPPYSVYSSRWPSWKNWPIRSETRVMGPPWHASAVQDGVRPRRGPARMCRIRTTRARESGCGTGHGASARLLLVGGLVLVAYLAGRRRRSASARAPAATAAWFPAAGVGVLAVLLAPRRLWPLSLARARSSPSRWPTSPWAARSASRPARAGRLGRGGSRRWLLVAVRRPPDASTSHDVVAAVRHRRRWALVAGRRHLARLRPARSTARSGRPSDWSLPSHAASVMLLAPLALLGTVRRPQPAYAASSSRRSACTPAPATLVTFGAGHT